MDRSAAEGPALRYVALGDSYTIGTSVAAADRWPDRLVAALKADGAADGPWLELVANLGVDGYTTADLIRDELPPLAGLRPDVVSVLIGVNDVVQGVVPGRLCAERRPDPGRRARDRPAGPGPRPSGSRTTP